MESLHTGIGIASYRPASGAHLCSLWTDPATDRLTASAFLRGAGTDEDALCIFDTFRESQAETRSAAAAFAGTRTSVFFTDDVHIAGGYFDPDRMRGFWSTQARKASSSGMRHVRAVAEMAWALRGCPGTTQAPVFESSLNPHLSPFPMSVICQYGSTRFAPELLLAMILSHPLVCIADTVFLNPFSVGHERFGAHYDTLKAAPVAALKPVWAYFLSAQRSLSSIGVFLCNSLPTLVAADRVVVTLRGLPSPVQLAVCDDRVAAAEGALERQLSAASAHLPLRADGPWGDVRSGQADGMALMAASFADGVGRIAAIRKGAFSPQDERQFVMLAWHTAQAIEALQADAGGAPGSGDAAGGAGA